MKRHVFLENGFVSGSDTRCVLAPIRRITESHRIADAVFFLQVVFCDRFSPDTFDGLAGDTGLCGVECGLETFDNDLCSVCDLLRWLTDERRPRQRGVIPVPTAGEFDYNGIAPFERPIGPCEVRCSGVIAGGHQRNDRRVVATERVGSGDQCLVDRRSSFVFGDPLLDRLETGPHRQFRNPSGFAHILEFPFGLFDSNPVDQ